MQIEGKRKGTQPRQQTEARKQANVWQATATKMDDLHTPPILYTNKITTRRAQRNRTKKT
jgi:hypothetical protein